MKLKYKEIFKYIIFGILSTIVNLLTYYLLTITILNPNNSLELQISNIIAWINTIIFAYITNKKYVFNSKNNNTKKELIKFFISRIVSLLLEVLLMHIFVTRLYFNDKIIKLIIAIIIIIINYLLSKLFVFKSKKNTSF